MARAMRAGHCLSVFVSCLLLEVIDLVFLTLAYLVLSVNCSLSAVVGSSTFQRLLVCHFVLVSSVFVFFLGSFELPGASGSASKWVIVVA